MEQKIQELTEKIYQEGVEKGEEKARQIIADAQERSSAILADARMQAQKILDDANKQASELKRNTESEIRLSGTQAISAIKQQLLDLLTAKMIDHSVSTALSDPQLVKDLILEIAKKWNVTQAEAPDMEVLLPENKKQQLEAIITASVAKELGSTVEIKFSKAIKSGFRIGPSNGTFKISLTDEDFKEFFKDYVRPRTRSYLFGE